MKPLKSLNLALATAGLCAALVSGCSYMPWHKTSPKPVSPETAAWCADATLFSMHLVRMHQVQPLTYPEIKQDLKQNDVTYQQQYPALSMDDMHKLLSKLAKTNPTRFQAGKRVVDTCDSRYDIPVPKYAPDYLRKKRGHAWCAAATDFAMGMAGYRDLGFTEKNMIGSQRLDPLYQDRVFLPTKTAGRIHLVHAVFKHKWSRFDAANALVHACH